MNLSIRPAQRDDIATLVRFNVAMAQESEDKPLDAVTLETGIAALFDQPAEGRYLMACDDDGTALGALLVTYEWSDWRNGRFWWIQSVYVVPDARRRGVYRALHEHVRAAARSDPDVCGLRLYVERDNDTAQRTYRTMGMIETAYRLYEEEFERS
jgi:GNAT superfamily N-acetyltransferase